MPVFGQTREDKISNLQPIPKPEKKPTINPIPVGNIGIVNLEQKKKPHNITIKNHNPKEPKINPNIKYTEKQRFRRYKTRTEPNLHSKIEINEEDDIVNKIKEAFGIKAGKKNTNYSEEITTPAPFNNGVDIPPEIETKIYTSELKGRSNKYEGSELHKEDLENMRALRERYNEIDDISPQDQEALTYQSPSQSMPLFEEKEIQGQLIMVPTKRYQEEKEKELKRISSADTPYNKKEALDQLTYALTPYSSTIKNNLRGKSIKKDFESFKEFIDKDDPNYISSFALGTDRYGNLDILPSGINEEKRKARYSASLNEALPTPKKEELKKLQEEISKRARENTRKILTFTDSSTSPRKVGRPRKETYLKADPSKFTTEITEA